MKDLILVSHGSFCTALKESTEMIMGPQEQLHAVPLLPEEGPDQFLEKFNQVRQGLEDGEYVVFADLAGGTPCNVCVQELLKGDSHFDFYVGMNLPMVIAFLNAGLIGQDDADPVEEARQGIFSFNQKLDLE